MKQLFDPTACCMVDESTVLKLTCSGGYQPCLSPRTGQWFAIQTWLNQPCLLEAVDDDFRPFVNEIIKRYELTEELCARIEMMRAEGETPTERQVIGEGSMTDHLDRSLVFNTVCARGYARDEVIHAYNTLSQLERLTESTLGAQRVSVGDDLTIEAEEPSGD